MNRPLDYHCLDCTESFETRKDVITHCQKERHGWFDSKPEKFVEDGVYIVGEVAVDSGTVMIGDPCYMLPDHEEYDTVQNWNHFCNIMADNNHLPTQIGFSVASSTLNGDGLYPVLAKMKGNRPEWIKVSFKATKYQEIVYTVKHVNVEATRKAYRRGSPLDRIYYEDEK